MATSEAYTFSPDLDRCAQEQVQIIGKIQPHGLLFAISESDLVVRQVSANVAAFLGMEPDAVLGRSFETVLGVQQFEALKALMGNPAAPIAPIHRALLRGGTLEMECIPHRRDGALIVELEPLQGVQSLGTLDLDAHIRIPLINLGTAFDIPELSRRAACEIRTLSGFDRVFIYRFDKEWNGEVIAEAVGAPHFSLQGLCFPAGDIPPQARKLMLANTMRAIVDVNATQVPIVPEIAPLTGRPLDLTYSVLRSASPIHLEYLRNMGARSSLAISIVVKGQLWGMIACHGLEPHRLSRSTRSICEMIAQTLAVLVASLVENAGLQSRLESGKQIDSVMAGMEASPSAAEAVQAQGSRLLELFEADGLVSSVDGVHSSHGVKVAPALLVPAIDQLRDLASHGVASSDRLGKLSESLEASDSPVAGALYIQLSDRRGDYLLFLRREFVETIAWAGNPNKAVIADEHDRLHPRKSFEAWQEIVHGVSRPWTDVELECGLSLRERVLRMRYGRELALLNQTLKVEIGERKQAEQVLKASEEKFRQMAENIREVFWMMNADGSEILYVGPAYEQIWGRTCASLYKMPMDWLEAVCPEDREQAHETLMRQMRGEIIDSEYRIMTPEGQTKWIRDRAFPVRDEDGQITRVVGTAEEITERKRAEGESEKMRAESTRLHEALLGLELEKANDMYRIILGSAGEGIYGLDVNGLTTFVNPAALAMLGYTSEELIGKSQHAMVHHSFSDGTPAPRDECLIYMALHDGRVHRSDSDVFWKRDGTNFPVAYTSTPIMRDGKPDGAVVTFQEISERRRRERADAANQAKSEFLANMSHEIRTPMNGVIGMTGLLLDTDLTPEQRMFAETVRASGESLLGLLNDILDFSKIEAKKLELEAVDFDLRTILDNLGSILSATARAKEIQLQCTADLAVPTQLRGDPGRLRQILTNLTANAIKFTEKGEVLVRVVVEEETESDCLLRFSVHDTGIGIPQDKIGTLFNKFSQVEVSTNRKYGGTGLGLAISKQLAELLGGGVGVASQEGTGSEFWFTARFKRSSGQGGYPEGTQTEFEASAPLKGRILIAEDNSTNRMVSLGILRNLGLQADAVADGAEAIRALQSIPYDLVLMDMRMPVMDGIEAARQIRKPQSTVLNRDIPIIALTANAMQNDQDSCIAAGMNDFVPKPVSKRLLGDALRRWLPNPNGKPILSGRLLESRTGQREALLFDHASVLSRLEGDEELAHLLFEAFLEDIPMQIQALKDLVNSGNAPGSARLAHSIRGASANVGGECLRNLAFEMEQSADAGNLHLVAGAMGALELQLHRLQHAIKERHNPNRQPFPSQSS